MPSKTGATPIIWGNNIFLNVADADNNLYLWCVDKTKGTVIWKKLITGGNYQINKQNMSSPSPVTDGKNVFAMTGVGILKGFDFAGTELWTRDIQKDYGKFGLNWGYASSPLLYEDSLYVQVLHGMKTRRSVLHPAHRQEDRQDAVARGAADGRDPRVSRFLFDAAGSEVWEPRRDRGLGRRLRDRSRSRDRKGAVAGQRPEPHQQPEFPHHRVRRGVRRHRIRAHAGKAADRVSRRRQRRHHASRTSFGRSTTGRMCRPRSPTESTSTR